MTPHEKRRRKDAGLRAAGAGQLHPLSGGYHRSRVKKPRGLSMRNRSQGWHLNSEQRRKDSSLGAQSPVYEARSRCSTFRFSILPNCSFHRLFELIYFHGVDVQES